jgi:hypothetical protein
LFFQFNFQPVVWTPWVQVAAGGGKDMPLIKQLCRDHPEWINALGKVRVPRTPRGPRACRVLNTKTCRSYTNYVATGGMHSNVCTVCREDTANARSRAH